MNECEQLKNSKTVDVKFFQKVILVIKDYADGFHHLEEEDILFKVMLEEMETIHCNPIPVMLNEHDAERQYVKGMEEALLHNDVDKLIENVRGYSYLLQEHVDKEDNND